MFLELFVTTMEEYVRFSNYLKLEENDTLINERDYISIQTRLMLLRKYTSKGKKNHVYIENLINEAKTRLPDKFDVLNNLQNKFVAVNKQQIVQILSDGTKLNLYETIEDLMYGLYLHADQDKILRLSRSNEQLRFYCTRKFVEEIENIILELYDLILDNGISGVEKEVSSRAPIVYLGDLDSSRQQIKQSPYWENLYGSDDNSNESEKLIKELPIEELSILYKSYIFLQELKNEYISLEKMKLLVLEQTLESWGDFSEAAFLINRIPNAGLSNKIRFNNVKDIAYVYLLPEVKDVFIINTPHLIPNVYEIIFKRDNDNEWRIYSFGGHVEKNNSKQ